MSVTTRKPPAPIEEFRTQLTRMTPEFANALPSHVKPEKFQRVVMTAVQKTPALLNADRRSLFGACVNCAADGLVPDGREAALVIMGSTVSYMPMLGGIQKRVRNSGEIASVEAHVIHEHDDFVWSQGSDSALTHRPKFPGDRGKAIGAYAIAKFKDGSPPMFEVMDVDAIERVRAVSRAAKSGPWVTWWDEMARKTVFRRLSKWLPSDSDVDDIVRRDDQLGVATPETPTIDQETGEILDGHAYSVVHTPDSFELAAVGVQQQPKDLVTQIRHLADAAKSEDQVVDLGNHQLVIEALANEPPRVRKQVSDIMSDAMTRVRSAQ